MCVRVCRFFGAFGGSHPPTAALVSLLCVYMYELYDTGGKTDKWMFKVQKTCVCGCTRRRIPLFGRFDLYQSYANYMGCIICVGREDCASMICNLLAINALAGVLSV